MEVTNATSDHRLIEPLAKAAFHVYDTSNRHFEPAVETLPGTRLLDLLPEGDKTLSDVKVRMQVHRMRTADGGASEFVVAIRGSDNLENWLVNLDAKLVPADKELIGEPPATGSGPATPMVHYRWQLTAIKLCNVLEEVLSKQTQGLQGNSSHLYCVGHSLGGALSVLLALAWSQRAPACKVHVYTWGAPMAGNDAFNKLCKSTFTSDDGEPHAVHFVNDLDAVPKVPSEALGFSPWLEAQIKIDTPESRSLFGPLAAAPGAVKMLLSGRKAAAVAKILNCAMDQLKHMHSCDLYFHLTLCHLGKRGPPRQESEQAGDTSVANAIRTGGGLVYEVGRHVSEFMPRQGEAVEAAAGLVTQGTKAAEWVAKASLAAGAANLAVTLIGQGMVVWSMWRLEKAVTGMRDELKERSKQLERMEAGVIEKIDSSFKDVSQQLKGVDQQLSKLDELVRDIPSQLRDARIDGYMEELRAAVKRLTDRDEQVWRQASEKSSFLFTQLCIHLDYRRGQIETETEDSSRSLLLESFERYYKDMLQLHLRTTNRLAKIADADASSDSSEVKQASHNQLAGSQRETHEALLANAGFLLWHASSCGHDGASVGASRSPEGGQPHQRPALYCSLLGTVENLLPKSEGTSHDPSDLAKSVYYSWLQTFTESALDAEWADSVLRLCQRELKHGHSLARARAFHGACQVLCTAVGSGVQVDLPVEVLTGSKIFAGDDVILSLAHLYMADHPEQSERRKVIRSYVLQTAAAEGRAAAGGASSGAAAAAVDAPLLGQRVVLGGLSTRPELNGQRGEARSFEGGRYAVALEGGESVRVRPGNLSPAVARAMVDVLVHICHGSARKLGRWLCDSKCAPNRSSITTELEELARARLRELVWSAQSADDLEQLRASLDAVSFAGMDESGLEEARCRLERDEVVARLSAACQGAEWSELWVAMRQAEKLGLDCEAVEAAKRRVDELAQPKGPRMHETLVRGARVVVQGLTKTGEILADGRIVIVLDEGGKQLSVKDMYLEPRENLVLQVQMPETVYEADKARGNGCTFTRAQGAPPVYLRIWGPSGSWEGMLGGFEVHAEFELEKSFTEHEHPRNIVVYVAGRRIADLKDVCHKYSQVTIDSSGNIHTLEFANTLEYANAAVAEQRPHA